MLLSVLVCQYARLLLEVLDLLDVFDVLDLPGLSDLFGVDAFVFADGLFDAAQSSGMLITLPDSSMTLPSFQVALTQVEFGRKELTRVSSLSSGSLAGFSISGMSNEPSLS